MNQLIGALILQEKILTFTRSEVYAVISTVDRAGQPESALVGFSITDDMRIVIGSNDQTRKVQNILLNPNIAIVIGLGSDQMISIQLEGIARVVRPEDEPELVEQHYDKIPSARQHAGKDGECLIVITPVWARYTDLKPKPEEVEEEYFDVD